MAATRLHLASDADLPLQTHLDELSARLGRLLALLTAAIIISWYWIDALLEAYLQQLSPCADCIIVYSPTEWVGLRWLSILLLACLLTTPFAFRELIRFSDPGLMRDERDWLRRLLVLGSMLGGGVVGFTLWVLLPELFLTAETTGQIPGVSPRYSAAAMLEVALVVAWVELIITLSTIAAILLNRLGLTRGVQLDLWRLRLHGTSIFLLWLLVPNGFEGLLVSSIILDVLLTELGFRYTYADRSTLARLRDGAGILDTEARLRRIGIVDCSCAGACPRAGVETLPDHMLGLHARALCLDGDERDRLIETVHKNRLTDIYISSCDSTPLPQHFQQSLEHLDCSLRGLSMMDIISLRESTATPAGLQLHMLLASETDPWPAHADEQRRQAALQRFEVDTGPPSLVFESEVGRLGVTLAPDEVFIPSNPEDVS